jgi:hypothetical protein
VLFHPRDQQLKVRALVVRLVRSTDRSREERERERGARREREGAKEGVSPSPAERRLGAPLSLSLSSRAFSLIRRVVLGTLGTVQLVSRLASGIESRRYAAAAARRRRSSLARALMLPPPPVSLPRPKNNENNTGASRGLRRLGRRVPGLLAPLHRALSRDAAPGDALLVPAAAARGAEERI